MLTTTPAARQAKSLPDPAQQFASVAANLPGIVYRRVLAADGSITYPYVSRGIRTLLGYEAEEAMRDPRLLRSTISEKDRPRFAEAIRRSAEQLSSFDLELRSVTAAGEEIWVRSIARTEAGPDGSIVWDGVILDISDKKRAEQAAETAVSRLLGSLEALTEGVALFDAEDRLVLCNAKFRQGSAVVDLLVPGVRFEALIRAALQRGRYPEAAGREEEWLAMRMARHHQAAASFEQRTPEGRWLQVLEQRTPDGGIIMLSTDITEVKAREEALLVLAAAEPQQNALFAAVARSLQTGLDCRWTGICATLENGRRSRVLAWVDGERLLPTFEYALPGTPCADVLASGFVAVPDRLRERYPEDRDLPPEAASYVGFAIRDADGRPIGHIFGIGERPDPKVARRRELMSFIGARVGWELQRLEAERQLRRAKETAELASRSKSEFLANMSHELRTPLNAIIGFSQIIANGLLGPVGQPQYAEYARDIETSSMHLLQIINDILDVSKVEAGMMTLNLAEIDPAETLQACCRLIRPRAEAAGVTLTIAGLPSAPVVADERLVKQILLNLLSNAVKFTAAGGQVAASIEAPAEGGVVFTVSDTGIGIAEEHIEKVLQPFAQVDSSLSRRAEGTGLGLPLSRGLAELHGGRMILSSRLGEGTTVRVELPARPHLP